MPNVITDELLDDAGTVIGTRIKQAIADSGGGLIPKTLAEIEALAASGQIQPLALYLIVDELRLAIGILENVYQPLALQDEGASGTSEAPSLIALSWATGSGSGGFM